MPAYHQIGSRPTKDMLDHRKRIGHLAPCSPAFIHDGFGDWFLDRIGNDTRQGIHALHQGTYVQRSEEVTIETRYTAEAAVAIGQKHLHAHDVLYLMPRREAGTQNPHETVGGPFRPSHATRVVGHSPDRQSTGEPEW